MPMRTLIERLAQLRPTTGRMIRELGLVKNVADSESREDMMFQRVSLKGLAYFFNEKLSIPPLGSRSWSLVAPADKAIVIYNRTLKVAGGNFDIDIFDNPAFTPGTPLTAYNFIRNGGDRSDIVTAGATGVSGGLNTIRDVVFAGTAPGQGTGVVNVTEAVYVIPAGDTSIIRVTNRENQAHEIRLLIGFGLDNEAFEGM